MIITGENEEGAKKCTLLKNQREESKLYEFESSLR